MLLCDVGHFAGLTSCFKTKQRERSAISAPFKGEPYHLGFCSGVCFPFCENPGKIIIVVAGGYCHCGSGQLCAFVHEPVCACDTHSNTQFTELVGLNLL